MNAFQLHTNVIESYKEYLRSFINIKDTRIREKVLDALDQGNFIPEPLIQFNPEYAKGLSLAELARNGRVHPDLPRIFGTYNLYKHQYDAIEFGISGKGFIVTSGTGSGKSLTFLATIFNSILNLPDKQKGIKAILVYPMNALINSQEEEIRKFHLNYLLEKIKPDEPQSYKSLPLKEAIEKLENQSGIYFPISYQKYTGQESQADREYAKENQPDIILTNCMMLELMMTREAESWLRDSVKHHLKFLVFDELHTYRGRQGSDVSFLIRRIKHHAENDLTCIGTSATMASDGNLMDRKLAVAKVAKTIFSQDFDPDQIIEETLIFSTNFSGIETGSDELVKSLIGNIDTGDDITKFKNHPFIIWLESAIALFSEDGVLRRGSPLSITHISKNLSGFTGLDVNDCKDKVIGILQWAEELNKKGEKCLPFKLHQFISQTSSVYVTLDNKENRHITIEDGLYIKEDEGEKLIYPVLFSRHSGHEYLSVQLDFVANKINPRDPDELPDSITLKDASKMVLKDSDFPSGYLVFQDENEEDYWQEEMLESLPDSWVSDKKGKFEATPFYKYQLPRRIYFDDSGAFSFLAAYENWAWYIPAKLRVDITSGVIYDDVKVKENTKLMRLGNEGRSTATTVIAYNVIKELFEQHEPVENQKLLSFTDNRQDASLQTGHFNDFLSTIRLRAALNHALKQNPNGLKVFEITERIADNLQLMESDYAQNPNDDWPEEENLRALKDYLLIRIFYDLKRGWRYTLPNLEQCGLLRISYDMLDEFAKREDFFIGNELLSLMGIDERKEFIASVLDFFRTSYAVYHKKLVDYRPETENFLKDKLNEHKFWSLDNNERIDVPALLTIQSAGKSRNRVFTQSIGPRSQLGKYIKRLLQEKNLPIPKTDEFQELIDSIMTILVKGNFLKTEIVRGDRAEVTGYRLRTDKIIWMPGDGQNVAMDKVRVHHFRDIVYQPNQYFTELYNFDFSSYNKSLIGSEHTGQLQSDQRIEREGAFRKGDISALFCSPTMELGIDIADLNIVHMRNVPPNPANYAQRSGRAGRSGQTAVIFTYCAAMSPHDRNYFKNKEQMISGSVVPPRIDLHNEELVTTHLNAFILMELGLRSMKLSVADVVDLTNTQTLPVKSEISNLIEDQLKNWNSRWIQSFRETG